MNLCPCGGRGDPAAECNCSPQQLDRYRERVSRPLLDRVDLVVSLPKPRAAELAGPPGEPTASVVRRVMLARKRLDDGVLELRPAAAELLDRAVDRLPLSGRGRAKMLNVAATIAALAGTEAIEPEAVAEALSYRSPLEVGRR